MAIKIPAARIHLHARRRGVAAVARADDVGLVSR